MEEFGEDRYRPAPAHDSSYRAKEAPNIYEEVGPPAPVKYSQTQMSPRIDRNMIQGPIRRMKMGYAPKETMQAPKIVKRIVRAPSVAKRVVKAPVVIKRIIRAPSFVKRVVKQPIIVNKAVTPVKQVVAAPAAAKKPVEAPKIKEKKPIPTVQKEEKQPEAEQVEKEETVKTPTVEESYELSPVMARALELELQQIMIQMWQLLPDTPSSEADKIVVEKFKNDAGDDLRNALALNVTKRILNVYNPFQVKVVLSSRPSDYWMKAFVMKFRIVKYQIVGNDNSMFTARLATVKDFDRLCDADMSRYGGLKLRVYTIYNFTKCPQKLKTKTILTTEEERKLARDSKNQLTIPKNKHFTDKTKEETKDQQAIPKEKQSTEKTKEENNNPQTTPKVDTNSKKTESNSTNKTKSAAVGGDGKSAGPKLNSDKVQVVKDTQNKKTVQPEVKKTVPPEVKKTVQPEVKKPVQPQVKKTVPPEVKNTVFTNPGNTTKSDNAAKIDKAPVTKTDNKTTPAKTVNTGKADIATKITNNIKINNNKPDVPVKSNVPAETASNDTPKTAIKSDKNVPAKAANTRKTDNVVIAAKNSLTKPGKTAVNTSENTHVKTETPTKPNTAVKTDNTKAKNAAPKDKVTNANKKASKEKLNKSIEEQTDVDPNDFLALMEEGIVLDECTASDEE